MLFENSIFVSFRSELSLSNTRRASREVTLRKLQELPKNVDGWDPRELGQSCNEFIREGSLWKVGKRAPEKERHALLFDKLLILCKVSSVSMS